MDRSYHVSYHFTRHAETPVMQKRIVILGAGESGTGTAVLAKMQGAEVFVSDAGTIREDYARELDAHGVAWEQGKHSFDRILTADEVIKSPGIPNTAEVMKKLRFAGIPILSEIDYAARFTNAKLIGISGTNGKTTTTLLTYHILKNAGFSVGLGGNVGRSFARQVATEDFDYYVLELSSFQLDDTHSTPFYISILTNITPDHLDRYNYDYSLYQQSKLRLVLNQQAEHFFIYNLDDAGSREALQMVDIRAHMLPFSLEQEVAEGSWVANKTINIRYKNTTMNMPYEDLSLKGRHNAYNSMAAGIAARILEIRKESVRESLSNFENVEHRLEYVATVKGVDYINDSKATNVNSTWYALESIEKPIVWVVGGVDKGNDYEPLKELVKARVKAIVCLGKDNLRIHEAFSSLVPLVVNTENMEECIRMCHHFSEKGDVVLLSPACASFDLFENYEDRGRQFKKQVRSL